MVQNWNDLNGTPGERFRNRTKHVHYAYFSAHNPKRRQRESACLYLACSRNTRGTDIYCSEIQSIHVGIAFMAIESRTTRASSDGQAKKRPRLDTEDKMLSAMSLILSGTLKASQPLLVLRNRFLHTSERDRAKHWPRLLVVGPAPLTELRQPSALALDNITASKCATGSSDELRHLLALRMGTAATDDVSHWVRP